MINTKLKRIILTALMGAVAVLFSGCSNSESYRLVKVNSFEGEVSVQREEKLNAFEGLQLISDDTVSVGDKSFLELLADSDKHIAAEENTGFVLHSTGDENSGDITIDLLYGRSLFTIDNKLTEGSTFAVNTPNATLSVRGTSFSVAYDEETKTTNVEVYSGTVQLNSGDEEMLIEKDGKATVTTTENGIKIIANSTAGNHNAIAVSENTEKLFVIAMTYPQQEGYSALNAEYKAKASDYTAKETGIGDNDIVFQKFIGLIKNHNSEISKFFEENKANAVANTNKLLDVTDWFKNKITVGDKEFRIDKAIMDMSIYGSNINKKYITSETYKVNTEGIDMYFCANGVEISFYGGFEKAAVVTTTATTTVPETTVPETTTVETTTTTTTTTAATTVPVTTTTTKATTKNNSVYDIDEDDYVLHTYVHYVTVGDNVEMDSRCFGGYLPDANGNECATYGEGENIQIDVITAICDYSNSVHNWAEYENWRVDCADFRSEEEVKNFLLKLHKYVDVHEDEIIAIYKKLKKENFKTIVEDGTSNNEGNIYSYKYKFDASDWFPKTMKYQFNDDKYEWKFDSVVASFETSIVFTDYPEEFRCYKVFYPERGEYVSTSGFMIRYYFYGTCKKLN